MLILKGTQIKRIFIVLFLICFFVLSSCHKEVEELTKNNKEKIGLYNQLCSRKDTNCYLIANGIITKLLLNHFNYDGIFENDLRLLKLYERNNEKKVSISRVILTYLSNIPEKESCSLSELFTVFDGVFTLEEILSTIKSLFDMRTGKWRHLLTFSSNSEFSLEKQIEEFRKGETDERIYSTIKITPAGITFLKTIAVSFEFYSSRLIRTNRILGKKSVHELPLIMPDNIQKIKKDGKDVYKFELIIRDVLASVKKCFFRLVEFDQEIMNVRHIKHFSDYKDSKYVFKKEDTGHLHKERIIFSHIGYINSFRLYLLNNSTYSEEIKKEFNKIIVDLLDEYLRLAEKEKENRRSVALSVYNSLREQIDLVKKNNYEDFLTKIETPNYFSNKYSTVNKAN